MNVIRKYISKMIWLRYSDTYIIMYFTFYITQCIINIDKHYSKKPLINNYKNQWEKRGKLYSTGTGKQDGQTTLHLNGQGRSFTSAPVIVN